MSSHRAEQSEESSHARATQRQTADHRDKGTCTAVFSLLVSLIPAEPQSSEQPQRHNITQDRPALPPRHRQPSHRASSVQPYGNQTHRQLSSSRQRSQPPQPPSSQSGSQSPDYYRQYAHSSPVRSNYNRDSHHSDHRISHGSYRPAPSSSRRSPVSSPPPRDLSRQNWS